MKRHLLRNILLFVIIFFAFKGLALADEQEQDKKSRPTVAVIQKNGKRAHRSCFKDEDGNGYCDNGSEQNWKCKNNCRRDYSEDKYDNTDERRFDEPKKDDKKKTDKKSEKKSGKKSGKKSDKKSNEPKKDIKNKDDDRSLNMHSPCEGCPFAGNCGNGCLAMLQK